MPKASEAAAFPVRAEYAERRRWPCTMDHGSSSKDPDQQPEQNLDTPQPQVMGTPNPMHMPQGFQVPHPRNDGASPVSTTTDDATDDDATNDPSTTENGIWQGEE